MTHTLEELRQKLDRISDDILDQLQARAAAARQVAAEKRRRGLPIRDPQRESQLLDRLAARSRGPLDAAAVRALFRDIIDACVAVMEEPRKSRLAVGAAAGPRIGVRVRGRAIGDGSRVYIAGPCSAESEEQLDEAATTLKRLGVGFFRAGAFKPRTSPYAFQGLGERGLQMLARVCRRHDLCAVTEATTPANVPLVAEYADVIQIGARNMYNYELLRAAGQSGRPVLLKRSFAATLDEWLNAAEYVALAGGESIILCERGIRTVARETRGTLDLSIVPLALAASRLPVVVDISHAAGRRDILPPLAAAAFAAGAHGVMLEVHPDPDAALSDAEQQLDLDAFASLQRYVAQALAATAASLATPNS